MSRLAQIALHPRIQLRRVSTAAGVLLLVRLFQGAVCWAILYWFFAPFTVPTWLLHLNFGAYTAANVALFFPMRREAMTPALVWVDLAANLLPIAVGAHWSGGIYSPLLPIFAIKIGSYSLLYGVDVGTQSVGATAVVAVALAASERAGYGPVGIEQVPLLLRQQLTVALGGLIFAIGVIGGLRFFRILQDRETSLAEAVGEKERLYDESLQHQQHLQRLSRRMMQVSEATTRRLARELHDHLGQALTAIKIDLGLVDRELPADSPLRAQVHAIRDQVGATLQSVRNLSQLLRPAVLDDLGLVPAVQSYTAHFGERTRLLVELDAPDAEPRLPRAIEVAVYRVLQEALTNVARHASARRVTVQLHGSDGGVTLKVADDGCGFDAAAFFRSPPTDHGMGILGMRERVATYAGRLTITSQPGAGTVVELNIPLPESTAEVQEDDDAENSRTVG